MIDRIRWIGPWRVASSVAITFALVCGVWWAVGTSGPPPAVAHPRDRVASATSVLPFTLTPPGGPAGSSVPDRVVVHVTGGVVRPGVVELPVGARVADAVAAAGGPVPGADPNAINLAAVVTDGQRVRVPWEGEDTVEVPPADVPTGSGPDELVDVNRDPVERLTTLPGIGPVIAAAIVDDRERHGAFHTVEDLLRVRGIGPAKLDAIRRSVRT